MEYKFSNCSMCPLNDGYQELVVGECNVEKLKDVELLIIAEAPASEEIKHDKPLVGKSGKIFREAFECSGLNKFPYLIINSVLCSNIKDGVTDNPPDDAKLYCRQNLISILKLIKPKVILSMGAVAMKTLGIEGSIMKVRGNFVWSKIKELENTLIGGSYYTLVTIHPSFVLRKGGDLNSEYGELFLNDIKSIVSVLDDSIDETGEKIEKIKIEKPFSFTIPKKYYDPEYVLVDIQDIKLTGEILYIFRDKNDNREFYKTNNKETYFYTRQGLTEDAPYLSPIADVFLETRKKKIQLEDAVYEGDLRSSLKHSIDYKFNKENERDYKPKICFMDIEIYNNGSREFPLPELALKQINSISFKLSNEKTNVWISPHPNMDSKTPTVPENINFKVFSSEESLLKAFAKMLRERNDIDVISFWNGDDFDIPYIFNRFKRLKIDVNLLSPVGVTYIEKESGKSIIHGLYIADQLKMYKKYGEKKEENYKLNTIAQVNLGKEKVAYEGTLDKLYEEDINKFILYSGTDAELLEEIENKLGHIYLRFEFIKICGSNWLSGQTTTGLLDPLLIGYAKQQNLVCRNVVNKEDKAFKGAIVRAPKSGLYNWVVDFDFSSLYPSIIISMNIGHNTYIAKIKEESAKQYIYYKDMFKENIEITFNPLYENLSTKKILSVDEFEKYIKDNDAIVSINGSIYKGQSREISFISEIEQDLMFRRKKYNDLKKEYEKSNNEEEAKKNHVLQLALKILSNSIYGLLSNRYFRFYNLDMAETITHTGQELSKFAAYHLGYYMKNSSEEIVPEFFEDDGTNDIPYNLYGDTDSLFVSIGDYLIDKKLINM